MTSPQTLMLSVALALTLLTAPLLAHAEGEGWSDDMEAALKQAQAQHKDILIDFTGSDWCGWCTKLNDEVFSQEAFKKYAHDQFVLVEMDFPQNKVLAEKVRQQNDQWQRKLGVEGFPTIALLDAQGDAYAMTGYQPGGAQAYVTHLQELQTQKTKRDQAFADAQQASGLEKAKRLHAGLEAVGQPLAVAAYGQTVREIVELDADNHAGLKAQYEPMLEAMKTQALMQKVMPLLRGGDMDQANAMIDTILAEEALAAEAQQFFVALKAQIKMQQGDLPGTVQLLDQAIAIDPASEMAQALIQAKSQLPAQVTPASQPATQPQ